MADESGWVIEAAWSKVGSPAYLYAVNATGISSFGWTAEWDSHTAHNRALRFSRKQDADAFVAAMWTISPHLFHGPWPVPMPRVAEHSWNMSPAKPDAGQP